MTGASHAWHGADISVAPLGEFMRPGERAIQNIVFVSRWLAAPFLIGLFCSLFLLVYRFFIDLFGLVLSIRQEEWHELIIGVLNLIDLSLAANLVLIVIFSTYENFIRKVGADEASEWPEALKQIDFSALKQKLLASIAGIASVDALAWYFELEKITDTTKLIWVIAFPLMFVVAMLILATADYLNRQNDQKTD